MLKSININLPIMASLIITPALSYKNEGFTNCICLDPHLIFEDNKIPDRKIWIRRISRQTGKIIFG